MAEKCKNNKIMNVERGLLDTPLSLRVAQNKKKCRIFDNKDVIYRPIKVFDDYHYGRFFLNKKLGHNWMSRYLGNKKS